MGSSVGPWTRLATGSHARSLLLTPFPHSIYSFLVRSLRSFARVDLFLWFGTLLMRHLDFGINFLKIVL